MRILGAMTIRAFLVEDSPTLCANLIEALEELAPVSVVGHAATEAGAVAWITANPRGWDLLIVDLFLNEGSGLGVLRAAGTFGSKVLLSNYATPDVDRKAREAGAHRVFDKSGDVDLLIDYCCGLDAEKSRPTS